VYASTCHELTITYTDFLDNSADYVSGGGKGGGLHAEECEDVGIGNSYFFENTSNTAGGGLYALGCDEFDVGNSIFEKNDTHVLGGGLYILEFDSASISGTTVTENISDCYAGGIYIDGDVGSTPDFELQGCTITKNTTDLEFGTGGGGLLVYDCYMVDIFNTSSRLYQSLQNNHPGNHFQKEDHKYFEDNHHPHLYMGLYQMLNSHQLYKNHHHYTTINRDLNLCFHLHTQTTRLL